MQAKKPYHKEDLRGDLLRAGRAFIEENGYQKFSMRTLAQLLGVSPGAAYHHFKDRKHFLLELAIDCFDEIRLEAQGHPVQDADPAALVKDMACKFVRFGLSNPQMLELLYESELTSPEIDPELQHYQEASHRHGADVLKKCLPGISDREASLRNISLWTSIYGLVSMINKRIIRPFDEELFSLDEITDWVVDRAVASSLAT